LVRGRIDRIDETTRGGDWYRERLWSYGHLFAIVPDLAVAMTPIASRRNLG